MCAHTKSGFQTICVMVSKSDDQTVKCRLLFYGDINHFRVFSLEAGQTLPLTTLWADSGDDKLVIVF